ncbi:MULTISPECIES: alkaline phosphatase family protein [unclassified Leifsonia]|uniref:alkaline phosphatase family protein n=1 Tax=unclassified Leifsonia TaxID=2663824 RepID=UPI001F315FAC|nr:MULTISPECIES: alkaline phosphatase family protein [unclassified Leifsonia]
MPMVPSRESGAPRLADVLASCRASITGAANPLGLPAVDHAIVLLVDGLGTANLRASAGHARFLASRLTKKASLPGVFPATTAVGLGSLCTGAPSGSHGLVGYRVLDAAHDRVVNQLSGWDDDMRPEDWQRLPTQFESAAESGIPAFAVGPSRFADSGLSHALLRGAEYVSAGSIAARFDAALRVVAENGRALVYVYVPELDMAAHARGWLSDKWIGELEALDAEVSRFAASLPASAGLIVTADHGVVDVPAARHVLFDTAPQLIHGVRHIGGDPRCLYLYLEPDAAETAADDLAAAWRESEGDRAWVYTRAEAVAAGLFGEVAAEVLPRIGDVIVAARKLIAYYDSREANLAPRSMIGQHGSLTDEESRVPCLRVGAYAAAAS